MPLPTYEQLLREANLSRHCGQDGAAEYFMGQIKRRFAHAEPAFLPSAEPPVSVHDCPPCNGTGRISRVGEEHNSTECETCWGHGELNSEELAAWMALDVPSIGGRRGTEDGGSAASRGEAIARHPSAPSDAHVFVVYEDGSADCERRARARGLDLGDDRVSTWRVGSGGWTGPLSCISCKAEIPVIVDALSLAAIVRTDDDPATDCTWDAWNKANAETIEVDGRAEIESILARDGFYDSGDCGAFARFTLRRVA